MYLLFELIDPVRQVGRTLIAASRVTRGRPRDRDGRRRQPSLDAERADEAAPADRPDQHVVILSGLSGGGKTAAAKLFEDLGYTVVDNLPGELLPELAELVSDDPERFDKVAIVLDVRAGDAPMAFGAMRGALEGRGHPAAGLLPRGARRGPDPALLGDAPPPPARRPARDRELDRRGAPAARPGPRRGRRRHRHVGPVAARAARADLHAASATQPEPDQLAIQLISFGFKYGVPLEADLVFDVRFMQNPYYIDELRQLSGLTEAVREFVLGQPVAQRVPRLPPRVPRLRAAGLRRRGQDAADDRHRLHRRLPPLDRHRRGAGDVAARARTSGPCRSSTASWSARDANRRRPRSAA